jgi:hypothetical protein
MTGEIKATSKLSPGLGVGTALFLIARSIGYISGGAFNPAIGFGIDLVDTIDHDSDQLDMVYIYFIGPFIGGILATGFCLLLRPAALKVYGKEIDSPQTLDYNTPKSADPELEKSNQPDTVRAIPQEDQNSPKEGDWLKS